VPAVSTRFKSLDDGTLLYRKNSASPTYSVTDDQCEELLKLHNRETLAVILLAPPLFVFAIKTIGGEFGLLWNISAAYAFFYCVFNFLLNRKTSSQIDAVCQSAVPAEAGQEIKLSSYPEHLKKATASLSYPGMLGAFAFFLTCGILGFLIFCSLFVNIEFIKIPDLPWWGKFWVGVVGTAVFGIFAYFAFCDIRERRAEKRSV
jgi:hypothetical protein